MGIACGELVRRILNTQDSVKQESYDFSHEKFKQY